MLTALITAATGFLIAVLWFDLMFDVQVIRHRHAASVPEDVLDSISAYYRRVTTTASPMGRLVAVVMLILIAALAAQAVRGNVTAAVSAVSLLAAIAAVGLVAVRVLARAQRLGAQSDLLAVRSELAWSILRDHLACLAAMIIILSIQIAEA